MINCCHNLFYAFLVLLFVNVLLVIAGRSTAGADIYFNTGDVKECELSRYGPCRCFPMSEGEASPVLCYGFQYTDSIETEELAQQALLHPYARGYIAPHMHARDFSGESASQS